MLQAAAGCYKLSQALRAAAGCCKLSQAAAGCCRNPDCSNLIACCALRQIPVNRAHLRDVNLWSIAKNQSKPGRAATTFKERPANDMGLTPGERAEARRGLKPGEERAEARAESCGTMTLLTLRTDMGLTPH